MTKVFSKYLKSKLVPRAATDTKTGGVTPQVRCDVPGSNGTTATKQLTRTPNWTTRTARLWGQRASQRGTPAANSTAQDQVPGNNRQRAKATHKHTHRTAQPGLAGRRRNTYQRIQATIPSEAWRGAGKTSNRTYTPQTPARIGGVNTGPTPKHTEHKRQAPLAR